MRHSNWLACGCGFLLLLIPGSGLLYWQRHHAGTTGQSGPAEISANGAEAASNDISTILTQWKAARSTDDPSHLEKLRAYRTLSRLSASDCQAMAETALSLPKEEQEALLGDVLSEWVATEGEAAMTWALGHLPSHPPIIGQIGRLWAWRDPRSVLDWQERMILENEDTRSQVLGLCVETWLARSDAETCAQALIAGMQKNHYVGSGNWTVVPEAVTNPEQAQAFARGLESGEEKLLSSQQFRDRVGMVLSAFSERWQEIDPAGWETWAAAQPKLAELASSRTQGEAARFAVAPDKASEAARWLAQSPPENQAATMGQIINTWAARDLDAAGAWLATQVSAQGSGENTWAAAEAFAKHAAAVDPAAAFQWAATIGDPARRARAERQTFLRWHDAEPAAAMAWLETSGWSADQQTAVREMAAVRAR